jgi:hypothetical protein
MEPGSGARTNERRSCHLIRNEKNISKPPPLLTFISGNPAWDNDVHAFCPVLERKITSARAGLAWSRSDSK